MVFSTTEVSFDERIALELDALDQLGAVESPVAERQAHTFPVMLEPGCDEEENFEQQKTFDRGVDVVDRSEHGRGLDCDEVRIMIKVLGTKVCIYFVHKYIMMISILLICVKFFFLIPGVW